MSETDALTLATNAVQLGMLGRTINQIKPEELARLALKAAGALPDDAQPLPVPNAHPSAHDLAIELLEGGWVDNPARRRLVADLGVRKAHGLAKYGVPLQPFNGRAALTDAYEEIVDLVAYLTQYCYEEHLNNTLNHLGQTAIELLRNRILSTAVQMAGLLPGTPADNGVADS